MGGVEARTGTSHQGPLDVVAHASRQTLQRTQPSGCDRPRFRLNRHLDRLVLHRCRNCPTPCPNPTSFELRVVQGAVRIARNNPPETSRTWLQEMWQRKVPRWFFDRLTTPHEWDRSATIHRGCPGCGRWHGCPPRRCWPPGDGVPAYCKLSGYDVEDPVREERRLPNRVPHARRWADRSRRCAAVVQQRRSGTRVRAACQVQRPTRLVPVSFIGSGGCGVGPGSNRRCPRTPRQRCAPPGYIGRHVNAAR